MPFGLANAPAIFQAYINKALGEYVNHIYIVYLDDTLIYSSNMEIHVQDVRAILARLKAYDLYCNLDKCIFFTEEVKFLGFIIGQKGVRIDPRRVETIKQWPTPKGFKEVQIFIGFCNFYRRFIEGFSRITRALTALLKGSKNRRKSGPFEWNKEAEQVFHKLHKAFTTALIIKHFDPELPIKLEIDALGFAIIGILSQLQHSS
jgi:hypothetical protein